MSTPLTVNGVTYQYPTQNDQSWGQQATLWATAMTAAVIPKAGGTFNLTGELNFGTQFGLHVKTLRLNNTDVVAWRNAANSADLPLTVNASNAITFNGSALLTAASYAGYLNASSPPTLSAGYPGLYATPNANGKLNLTAPANLAHSSFTLSTGGISGQIRQNFLNVATSTNTDQYNSYITFDSNPLFYGTGSILLPNGTTAQRAAATSTHAGARDPVTNTLATDTGSFRYNTDYKTTEYHDGRRWVPNAYADQLRVAPQIFDDFLDGTTNWATSTNTTAASFISSTGSFSTTVGTVSVAVNSGGATGTAQLWKNADVNPTNLDYAEFRYNCTLGSSVACGIARNTGTGVDETRCIRFGASFTGGNGTAHGTGNWFAFVQDSNQSLQADTGVAVPTGSVFQTLRFEMGSDKKTVKFYIDGTLVATLTLTAVITRPAELWTPYMYVVQQNVSGTYYGTFFADYCAVKFVNIRN